MIQKRYAVLKTAFGELFITAENGRIIRISTDRPHVTVAMRQDSLPVLRDAVAQIRRYLSGESTQILLPQPLRFVPFQRDVFERVCAIPYGHTQTSDAIAAAIGKPHAVRAVETVCRCNPFRIAVPCHRVIVSQDRGVSPCEPLTPDEALRRLEKRYLDKGVKRR